MFAAAEIAYDSRSKPVTLQALRDHLRKTVGGEFELTEWRWHEAVIPQLLIKSEHPWTLQIEDDPQYVPEQIAERAREAVGVLPAEKVARLRRFNATLVAMGVSDQAPRQEVDGQILVIAGTTLDPSEPGVRQVLLAAAEFVDGLAYDLTKGKWIDR